MDSTPLFLLVLVCVLVVAGLAVAQAYGGVDQGVEDKWAGAHGLSLTPENRSMVSRYLRTARILRTWGAVGGVILPGLLALVWSGHPEVLGIDTEGGINPGDVGWIFLGYLIGVVYAEVALVRPVDPARRSASLVPRDLHDYLPRRLLLAQRLLGAAIVVGALVTRGLPYADGWAAPGPGVVVGFVAWVVVLVAGLEHVQRWLVRRPQPFTDPSLVAADDAIRSQSVHSVAGAGLAMLLLLFAGVSVLLASADVALLRWTMWLPALAAALLALVACQYFGHAAWRVRRPVTPPAPSDPAQA